MVGRDDEIIFLTAEAEKHMYSGMGREGMRPYEDEIDAGLR